MSSTEDEGTGVSLDEAAITPEDLEDAADAGDFKLGSDFDESFAPEPIARVLDQEGLPAPVVPDQHDDAIAPPYTEESFICMADEREWVVRDRAGRIVAFVINPELITRAFSEAGVLGFGTPVENLAPVARKSFTAVVRPEPCEPYTPATVPIAFPRATLEEDDVPHDVAMQAYFASGMGASLPLMHAVAVQPVRLQCEHLLEKMEPMPPRVLGQGYKYGFIHRYCTLQRSISGAYLTLTDGAVRACSQRVPVDLPSRDLQRQANREKAFASRNREFLPMFAPPQRQASSESPMTSDENAPTPTLDQFHAELLNNTPLGDPGEYEPPPTTGDQKDDD